MPLRALLLAFRSLVLCTCLFSSALTHAQYLGPATCGELANGFGPYDYRVTGGETLSTVERFHFTPKVENLIKGSTTDQIAADIAYTLHAFPNHHRALISMEKLGQKYKTDQPPGARYTVECYYERAVRFKVDDTVARALYVQFLARQGRKDFALAMLGQGLQYLQDNPLSIVNIGLLYFDLGEYEKSLEYAHKALELGFEDTRLIDKLKKIGKWVEPEQAQQ